MWSRKRSGVESGPAADPAPEALDSAPTATKGFDLIVHVGTGKTGTTSVQHFMNLNRDRLGAADVLYPTTPGKSRHAQFTVFLTPDDELDGQPVWHRMKAEDPKQFRRRFRHRLLAEIAESGHSRVVLSEETIFKSSVGTLRRLRRFSRRHARSLRIVVYLRRQDDHLVSRYQQGVKVGEIRRLSDPELHRDYGDVYDYAGRLALLEELLAPDELVVRRFERDAFVHGSLFCDFLDAVGVDPALETVLPEAERNVSLGAETTEFLRLLNLHRVRHEGARAGMIDNRAYLPALAGPPQGPTLTLPEAALDEFMAQWEAGNREIALRWFSDDGSRTEESERGVLFRMPRRTADTTTRQWIDPARIDYFVDLLELPDELRRPLRLLAEQELEAE